MPPEIGRCPNQNWDSPHKQEKFQNMEVGFTLLPRSVTACGQTAVMMALNNTAWNVEQERHRVEREEGNFERRFPLRLSDKELLHDNLDNTNNFAQAAMFNATTRQVQQHWPVNFTQAHASTTSTSPVVKVHQLHIYNNHNNIPWDSDTLAFIDSFHPSQ